MSVFYVDFENVSNQGLSGIEKLSEKDKVIILYSDSANCIHFDCVEKLLNCKTQLEIFKTDHGTPNALDFQLVSLMFLRIRKDEDTYIVSKDNGFDAAVKLGRRQGIERIYRISTINEIFKSDNMETAALTVEDEKPKETSKPVVITMPAQPSIEEVLKAAIAGTPGVSKKNRPIVYDALTTSKGKADFYHDIIKMLGQQDGLNLYRLVKSHFTEWKQLQQSEGK